MITDRTLSDVTLASTLRKKIQSGQSLTETEKTQFERGSCTITMINRINGMIKILTKKLNSSAYRVVPILDANNKSYTDILTNEAYLNIFNNLNKLKNAFYIYSTTPDTPDYLYGYQEANDVEKILVDISNMINDMKNRYRQCGTFQCGEVNTN